MRKIISLFQRNYEGARLVKNEITPGAEWVIAGEGTATRKFDGTACLVRNGKLYRRYDAKAGKTPPPGFEPTEPAPDEHTGHWPGWLPVGDEPATRWHREAWEFYVATAGVPPDGTYELLGPKIQGNPEKALQHILMPHNACPLPDVPRAFGLIKLYLVAHDIEGIVWWRDINDWDCDKVKVKSRDFGFKRGAAAEK